MILNISFHRKNVRYTAAVSDMKNSSRLKIFFQCLRLNKPDRKVELKDVTLKFITKVSKKKYKYKKIINKHQLKDTSSE